MLKASLQLGRWLQPVSLGVRSAGVVNHSTHTIADIDTKEPLEQQYAQAHAFLKSKRLPQNIDPKSVFANAQLDLAKIEVYGFDYDYTLASYLTSVESFIHDTAKQVMVEDLKYPKILLDLEYEPQSSARGLHYDIEKGLLLKLDQFLNIQLGTVYRGKEKLSDDEVIHLYKRSKIPSNYVNAHRKVGGAAKMVQLVDIFAKPSMCLLRGVTQWFLDNYVKYVPESIFADVMEGINRAHPLFHALVAQDPGRFLEKNEMLTPFLTRLKDNKKQIFLITNSPFELVNAGMVYMIGEHWQDIFDIVIVQANKPSFFSQSARHFRRYLPDKRILSWQQIHGFKKGRVYARGNMSELQELTRWPGDRVLYFGDHPYADLADLSLNHGWRTGAIIQELEDEIGVMNNDEYKWSVNWANILQTLLEDNQERSAESDRKIMKHWQDELDELRSTIKVMYNPFFGSIFRTHQNPTYFSRRLFRFADIYTSRITNINDFSLSHSFYPRRGALPHDFRSWFV